MLRGLGERENWGCGRLESIIICVCTRVSGREGGKRGDVGDYV